MSKQPRKNGRPKKRKVLVEDKRTPIKETGHKHGEPMTAKTYVAALAGKQQRVLNILERQIDPYNNHPEISQLLARVLSGFKDQDYSIEMARFAVMIAMKAKNPEEYQRQYDEAQTQFNEEQPTPATIADCFAPAVPFYQHWFDSLEDDRQRERTRVVKVVTYAVEHFTADEAKDFFEVVVALIRKQEEIAETGKSYSSHRTAQYLKAYDDSIIEKGHELSHGDLQEYATEPVNETPRQRELRELSIKAGLKKAEDCKLPPKYQDMPALDDYQGWTRLRKAVGLSELAKRKPLATPKKKIEDYTTARLKRKK